METQTVLPEFVEFLALVYHEGRNASRLFRLNAASRKTFGTLAGLPPEDAAAWDRLIVLQHKAASSASASEAQTVFSEAMRCSLEDLRGLFGHNAWHRMPMYGGSRWAAIAESVAELGQAIDGKDDAAVRRLIDEIPRLRHNTGTVRDNLAKLKAARR